MDDTLFATVLRAAAIVAVAALLYRLGQRGLERLRSTGRISSNGEFIGSAVLKWGLVALAIASLLQQFGVSVHAVWTALSAALVLVAVGFVALWSVLSNMLCAFFLVVFSPFRIGDRIEVIELVLNDGSKRGLRGTVTGIDLMYTTLTDDDQPDSTLRVPNNLLFQRALRTIHGADTRSLGSDLFTTETGDGAGPDST